MKDKIKLSKLTKFLVIMSIISILALISETINKAEFVNEQSNPLVASRLLQDDTSEEIDTTQTMLNTYEEEQFSRFMTSIGLIMLALFSLAEDKKKSKPQD